MRPVLAALLGHWRRHPLELATLLVGLAVATALWSGVQALNAEARDSYARAERLLGDRPPEIVPLGAPRVALADYVALRRAGWKASPVIEGDLRRGDASLRLVGVDILTLPPATIAPDTGEAADFLLPPWRALAAPETAARLAATGAAADLPPLVASDAVPPDTLVLDIAAAARLLDTADPSRLLLAPAEAARPLPPDLARRLAIRPPEARSDLDRLTASFHLNLTAFGALAFLVGLFIVYAAVGLAFEQRRPTFRTLRAVGVSARGLVAALLAETLALALLGGLAGVAAGYFLAAALLPDVAASLRGLYGARVPGSLGLAPSWWAMGLGISLAGALAATGTSLWRAVTLPLLAPAQPQAWLAAERRSGRRRLLAALLVLLAGTAALFLGRSLAAGFAVMAALLLAAALALPALLAALLAGGARRARRPVAAWAWADTRQELGGLSLALMALLLALAVNVGVGTMVGSFRATFTAYLDQRLAAEIYVTAGDDAEAAAIAAWLASRPEVTAVLPVANATARIGPPASSWPLEITGFRDHPTYRDTWPLLAALPDAWDLVAHGEAALVSEQTARRFGLAPGDTLTLPAPTGPWPVTVAALYPDYGNPEAQVMLAGDALAARWPGLERRRLAVRADPAAVPALLADLRAAFPLEGGQAADQRAIKAASLGIFEKTFAVTVALNALTLAVAGIALLASLLALADARLTRLAPVWAIGVTRRRLALIELAKATGLAALTAVFALPLGLALAWVLTAVVNVRAFGWRLPVLLFPGQWATLLLLALATAAIAALWPALRLRRTSPLRLLQGFSNER